MNVNDLPVVVIGAGSSGLAAAAQLRSRGLNPLVLEAAPVAGASVREWSHVRLFSPWSELVDPEAEKLLVPTGWTRPEPSSYPTGVDWAEKYLQPLADVLGDQVRYGARVVGVARRGRDLVVDSGRESEPFVVHVATDTGIERIEARAVIDASGTWSTPNPLGAEGVAADGELEARDRIFYGIPAPLGAARARYAGRRVLVIGSGHSAFNVLLDLIALAEVVPATRITWAIRRPDAGLVYGGGAADALPARGALGTRLHAAVSSGRISLITDFRTAAIRFAGEGVTVVGVDGAVLGPFDEIVGATGFRPDLSMTQELRLELDPAVESPRVLAPLIDPNVHSCGTVPPHGVEELRHPEAGFYIVGMKSYGRAPTFLMLTGYEQVRSVVAALTGDMEAARRVELTLPETGVCSSTPEASCDSTASAAAGCCAPEPTIITTLAAPARRY